MRDADAEDQRWIDFGNGEMRVEFYVQVFAVSCLILCLFDIYWATGSTGGPQ